MIRKWFIKIVMALVPKKSWRQYLTANFDFFDIDTNVVKNKIYPKLYLPMYNRYVRVNGEEPQIYNADGTPIRTFFLRDKMFAHTPAKVSKYFMFDRYNFELPVHFYTHSAIRQIIGQPQKRYGMLLESKEITPQDYLIFERNPNLAKEFDAVFTFDEKILNKLPNAREFCLCAQINFFNNEAEDNILDICRNKTKNVSICSSHKVLCDLHRLRYDWAMKFKNNPALGVDTFGNFSGGGFNTVWDYLRDYRYSIAVENVIEPYWFTEKILNCFATHTVPIYVGHSKMLERFNADGIILVKPEDYGRIEKIIKQCNKADYEARMPAIEDNFRRVQAYKNSFDRLYEKYLRDDLKK